MTRHELDEMYIYEEFGKNDRPTGVLSLNIVFVDKPDRVHSGYMEAGSDRAGVATMLRDLAKHIELDIDDGLH